MKLHLPLSLRSALLAALTLYSSAYAGVVGDNYAVQEYLDIAANAGQYSAGAQNVTVYKADGSVGGTLALIPSMSSFMNMGNGGAGLVLPQYAMSASHCKLPGSGTANTFYFSTDHEVNYYGNTGGDRYVNDSTTGAFVDTEIYRLSKIVTEATYAPMCTDRELMSQLGNLEVYRLGTGKSSVATDAGKIQLNINGRPHGGTVNVVSSMDKGEDSWFVAGQLVKDAKDPLSIGDDSGDSGSPVFVFNEKTRQFETVAAASTGTNISWGNYYTSTINPTAALAIVASMTDAPITADGRDGKVLWNVQGDADHGTLTQGGNEWQYHGKTSSNALSATKDLIFAAPTADTISVELQGNINNGAGSVTFKEGHYSISSAVGGDYTLNSAGFITERGAWLTTDYTGKAGDDWRKVGEGVWTIAGQGDNMVNLNVGGGVVRFDNDLNIIREGEVRLNRTGGVAADKVTLSAGIGSVVIMSDTKQFNSFAFGVGGGILNINGHNQSWDAISHIDSGATIANLTALGESRPQDATFTYTGNGIFKGSFADEGAEGAKLSVVYDAANASSEWVLAGQSHNAGGYVVQNGTLALQGINTEHVAATDRDDWVYAVLETPSVIVKDGAAFRMGHHALATTDITVEGSGQFILNSTVNKAQESVHGSNRQDVTDFTALRGNVVLQDAASSMTADTSSAVQTTMQGNITGAGTLTKSGSGDLYVDGRVNLSGGTISAGSLVVGDKTDFGGTWTIGADGTFGVKGMTGDMLAHIASDSTGVLALGADSAAELNLSGHKGLTIGALGDVQYGTADKTLTAQDGAWRLGGGGGNLFVNFKLAGENDLVIGTEASGGTVTLTNNANTLSGNIIINGSGNFLRYNNLAALGSARVALNYGNSMVLSDPTVLSIMSADSAGVMELNGDSAAALNLSANKLALGAEGTVRYTGALSANKDGVHRFSGSGTLVVDTALSGNAVEVDGQGQAGGTIVLAQDYNGTVTAGGGLHLDTPNESGSIRLQTENNALANAAAVNLQKGATLDAAGSQQTVGNVSAETGAVMTNSSSETATLTLNNTANTALASGTLQTTAGKLNIVKTGAGTLELGNNNDAWQGTFTIDEGKVTGRINNQTSSSFGTNPGNTIIINEGGTLRLSAGETYSKRLDLTRLTQEVVGTGTLELSSGSTGVFLHQTKAFDGTVKLVDNTRMTIGNFSSNGFGYTNNTALANATIVVEAGSQARVTNQADSVSTATIDNYSDYVISGSSFAGSTYVMEYMFGLFLVPQSRPQDKLTDGALSVDCGTVLHGNVTLATDSSIASWSALNSGTIDYGKVGYVGGSILGTISGEGKTLTKAGNERISLRADAANTFGDFIIGGSSGSEGVAVRLEQGAAVDTHSTALGKGKVTLDNGLTLEFANAGTAGNSVTYTYDNAISAGNNATLRSTHDNTVLNGSVAMTGDTLNLATQNGSTLRLEQGVRGNGTLSIADGSNVALGGTTAGQFRGSIAAGAGSTVTLLSGKAAGSGVSMSFTDSLNLHLADGGDFRLEALTGSGDAPTLNLTYEAIGANGLGHLDVGSLTANSAAVALDFTHASGITAGTYTLLSGIGSDFAVATSGDTGVDYMSTAFSRGSDGSVQVTLSVKDGNGIWHGTDGAHNWNTGYFGSDTTAVFNDTAANRDVRVTNNVSIDNALIHTQEGYTFTAQGGKAAIGTLTQVADGTTVLNAGAAEVQHAVVDGGRLVVKDSTTLTGSVSGSGTLVADFGAGSGTITADMTGLNTLEVQSGRYESTGSVGANALVVKDGGQYYANGGTHATAMQVEGTGRTDDKAALQLGNGANVSGSVTAVADAAIGVDNNATGTISGNLNATADTTVTKTGAGTLMLNANNSSTLNGKLVIADGTVKIGDALALGSTAVAGRVVIAEGGTLDINGWGGAFNNYHVEMNGGTLTNTGDTVDTGKRQVVSSMTLTADSTVSNASGHDFGLIGSGYAATALNLQGHVLEKTGAGTYYLVKTTVTSGDGGKLKVSEGTLSFNPVSDGGSLQADIEMAGGALSGSVNLGDDVTLAVTKASSLGVNVQTNGHTLTFDTAVAASYANTISGNGALVKTGAAELTFAEAAVISGNDLSVQQGTVTVRRDATDGKSFGSVQLANGTTLKQFNTEQPTAFNEVDTLAVAGSATLQEDNHAGAWKVKSLQLAEGTTSATLNLTSSSASSVASVFELGDEETDGGNFAGEMVLKSTNSDYARSAVLQISNGEIADHAVINMASTGANNANQALGLGINAERVTIAGLESGEALGNRAKVFSGSVSLNTNAPAYTGDDTIRTLAIDTAAGTDAHFRGMVGKNLHIEKSGEGKQTLSGASSAFNGTISVAGGTLLLKDAALEMLNGGADVELRGGVLSLNDSLTLAATGGKAALLQGGSVRTSLEQGALSAGISGIKLNHAKMDIAAGASLVLEDVLFASSSQLSGKGNRVEANRVTFVADAGGNAVLMPAPQPMAARAFAALPQPVAGMLMLTNITDITLGGSDIIVDLNSFSTEELQQYDSLAIALGDGADFAADAHVLVTYAGNTAMADSRDGVAYLSKLSSVMTPEPATATLSLLALAALAMRRKRR